ncbi:MAG TPA: 2-oxo acid dehydrogenase subunit E2 [bacterium]
MDIRLPQLGEGADSGTVVNILVKVGETLKRDQTILELENEKAVAPIPSPSEGRVSAIHVTQGEKISVGHKLITLEGVGRAQAPQAPEPPAPAARPESSPKAQAPQPLAGPAVSSQAVAAGLPQAASPTVRKVARELGIDLARVRGSERGGRVLIADLRGYVQRLIRGAEQAGGAAHPAPVTMDFSKWGPVAAQPLSSLRKTIARRMSESWAAIPHVTQFDQADITPLMRIRKAHAPAYERRGTRLTLTPFLIKAAVTALKAHPVFNTSLDEAAEALVVKSYYHLGIAVDTDAGLIVPVIRDADKKSLFELSKELDALAEKARQRKLSAEELQGGTFTISNQGGIGGAHFTPIINRPEVAILGVGRGGAVPVVRDGKVQPRTLLPLAVSYDHRVIDGASAARFIRTLAEALEGFDEREAAPARPGAVKGARAGTSARKRGTR